MKTIFISLLAFQPALIERVLLTGRRNPEISLEAPFLQHH